MIIFRCIHCESRLGTRHQNVGKKIRCPDCGKSTRVPTEDQLKAVRKPQEAEPEAAANAIRALCPHCDTRFRVAKKKAGCLIDCPGCGNPVRIIGKGFPNMEF